MASTLLARKRASHISIFLILLIAGCSGPCQPAVDLESPPRGTDRDQLRTAMAQERPIFFETFEGERFYGEVRGTYNEEFVLSKKDPFEGDALIPMNDRMQYSYAEILRAMPVPEEGNSPDALVVGIAVFAAVVFAVYALVASSLPTT